MSGDVIERMEQAYASKLPASQPDMKAAARVLLEDMRAFMDNEQAPAWHTALARYARSIGQETGT